MTRKASQWTRPLIRGDGGWVNPGRQRRSGLEDDHDGAGELDTMLNPSLTVSSIAIAEDPGICPACDAAINPLTMWCRC